MTNEWQSRSQASRLPNHLDRSQPASSAEPPLLALGMHPPELCSAQPVRLYSTALTVCLAQGPS